MSMNINLDPNSFLLFVDETGHELLSDPNYPILGIGGCAVRGSDYDVLIRKPWEQLKQDLWTNPNKQLHATNSNKFSKKQKEGIANFFSKNAFFRFSAVMKITTTFPEELIPYQVVALSVMKRIEKIIPATIPASMHMIFEASDRTDKLMAQTFNEFRIEIDGVQIPIMKYRMEKSTREPGLEVADFVIHAAGTHVRNKLNGKGELGKNFACVFKDVPDHLISYIEIDNAKLDRIK